MATLTIPASQPWKAVLFRQIKERNQTQTCGYRDLVKLCNFALKKEKEYKERSIALEKEVMSLRQENNRKSVGPENVLSRSLSTPDLDARLLKMQEELTVSYKRNSDNAQHMLELNKRMKEIEEENSKKEMEAAHYRLRMDEEIAECTRVKEQMAADDKTFKILKEELRLLQEKHARIEEQNGKLVIENQNLVDRWLREKETMAEKMNETNILWEKLMVAQAQINNKATPHQAPAPLNAPLVTKTAYFEAASFLDCSAILPSKIKKRIAAHTAEVTCVAFSKSGLIMASGSTDKTVRLWDAPTGQSKTVLAGPTQSVMCVQFSPSDELFLGASNDNACRIWSLDNCRLRHTLTGHVGKVFSAAFADSQKVFTGSHDRTIKMWDLTKGYCTRTIFCFSSLNDLCIGSEGTLLISGHIDHHLRFWDTKSGEMVHILDALHDNQITSVSLSPDGSKVLTNSRDNTLKLIDVRTHEVVVTLKDENYRNGLNWTRACLSPDARYAAAGSMDGSLIFWNTLSGKVEKSIPKAHESAVAACAWNPMGAQFASAGDKDKTIVLWD